MALFDLYQFISTEQLKPAESPLYVTAEIPETQRVTAQQAVTEIDGDDGEQVEKTVGVVTENIVNRTVELVVTNPTEEICRKYGYKELQEGRICPEPSETQYIKITYEDGEKITVNKDIENKEVIDEPKPGEAPENPYMMWTSYTRYTETQVINSWREVEKPITPDAPEYNHDTQFLTYEDDTSAEDRVIRAYTVNEKTVETKEVPSHPEPVEYEAHPEWWNCEEHIDYSQEKVIVKSYTWETTEERRIAMLEVTKREFCLAIKELKGITYSQLMTLVESDENMLMIWRECIKLLRADSALDTAGQALGLTHEDINNIFRYIHGEINLAQLKGEEE